MTDTTAAALVDETFATGFSAGPRCRWFHVQMGSYTTDDGLVTTRPGGLHVAARGTNGTTGEPAFSITLPQESAGIGVPATNDHAKWLAYMNHLSSAGVPGFDTSADRELAGTVRVGGRTFGTDRHPFGGAVADPQTDLRLAAFAMTTIDLESFVVFDFLFTNRRVYAFYERLPFGRTATEPYAAFSYAVPVAARRDGDVHEATIAYDRRTGIARWLLNGAEVFRVADVGRRLDSREHLVVDLGGREETVVPRQLAFGMGLFTLLDAALGDAPPLVRLSDQLTYLSALRGAPHLPAFVDESSRLESRLFGQGAEMSVESYTVTYSEITEGNLR
jgi:hypothetical protein